MKSLIKLTSMILIALDTLVIAKSFIFKKSIRGVKVKPKAATLWNESDRLSEDIEVFIQLGHIDKIWSVVFSRWAICSFWKFINFGKDVPVYLLSK